MDEVKDSVVKRWLHDGFVADKSRDLRAALLRKSLSLHFNGPPCSETWRTVRSRDSFCLDKKQQRLTARLLLLSVQSLITSASTSSTLLRTMVCDGLVQIEDDIVRKQFQEEGLDH